MKRVVSGLFVGAMVTLSSSAFGAEAVRIGVITDMSGPYSDLVGPGFVTAVKMATEDFGGKVLDRPIEVLAADDQTKPDIAVTKAREWYDRNDVQVLFEGSNSTTAVALQRLGLERQRLGLERMAEMKKSKVNDFFGRGGYIRTDGRMVHDMYLVEVKKPSESKGPWDIAKVRQVIPGEDAVAPLEKSACPFLENR